jgi:hypothetical protein
MTIKVGRLSAKYFAAGVAAGALAIAISLLIRSLFGGPFLPELASQTLFSLTPGEFESQAVENFGPLAKYSAFTAAIVINFILYGIFGILIEKIHTKSNWKSYIAKAIQSSLISYIILLVIGILLVTTIQFRTGAKTISVPFLISSLAIPQLVFGFVYSSFYRKRHISEHPPKELLVTKAGTTSRREFLRYIIATAIAAPILYFGLNRLFSGQGQEQQESAFSSSQLVPLPKSRPAGFEDSMLDPLLASELTPTYLFYRIDINPIVPVVDEKTWNLAVKGLVDNPLTITYDEIRKMPSVEQFATLECVSNKIGGDLISTALWKGIKLKEQNT